MGDPPSSFKDKFKAGCANLTSEEYEAKIKGLEDELAQAKKAADDNMHAAVELKLLKVRDGSSAFSPIHLRAPLTH